MGEGLSRFQLVAYVGLGVALLLLGLRALGTSDGETAGPAGERSGVIAAEPVAGGSRSGELVVHVTGEVAEPGVYRLAVGSRVADALERAGGASERGRPDAINLAARLADGQQVVVPSRSAVRSGDGQRGAGGPVSLGSADASDLEELDGIGPVTAAKIIDFRDQRGGIGAIEELDEIPGIGPATVESLSDQLQP